MEPSRKFPETDVEVSGRRAIETARTDNHTLRCFLHSAPWRTPRDGNVRYNQLVRQRRDVFVDMCRNEMVPI